MKTLSGTILVADDDPDIREILRDTLNSLGARTITAANGQECLDRAETDAPDLILLDIEMPIKNGLEVLKELRQRGSEMSVIMITAYGTIERAVQAMKQGAYDFITKPFELDHVAVVVEKALERVKLKRGLEQLSQEAGERYRLVGGESPKMRQGIETAKKAAASRSTVLLLGESGTGKEIFARAIHNWSERRLSRSSPSIAWVSLRTSSKASSSAMRKARSPERISSRRARWSWRTAALFFSTRSGIFRRSCKPNF